MAGLNETPSANRLHITFFGKRNSGKSSLVNALTNQQISLVSNVAGTTTDPVYKSMELLPIGPVTIIDTAGFDDEGDIGELRVKRTTDIVDKTDLAILVFSDNSINSEYEMQWYKRLKEKDIPVVFVFNNFESNNDNVRVLAEKCSQDFIVVNAKTRENIDILKNAIIASVPDNYEKRSITGHLVKKGDTVLLVMPQDIQAPKGRLILPQVQVIRDLLDIGALIISVKTEQMQKAFNDNENVCLVITDSQIFDKVKEVTPNHISITSFSVLMANYKGDIEVYKEGAKVIDNLVDGQRVLIAEGCTHHALDGDIAKIKLPNMIRKYTDRDILIDNVSGQEFPDDLSKYSLVVHCGACMFNRKQMMSRIEKSREQDVPITNFGVLMAYINKVDFK